MTDNPNNEGFNLEEESFDNFESKKGSLGQMWRDKPMFKVGVVVVAAVVVFGVIILFGGSGEQKPDISMVPQGSEITAPPGTEEASPAYIEAVKEQNEARTEQAQKEGGSSLPTPIEPPVGRVAIPEEQSAAEDPLQRWRKLQEERLERELQRTQTLTPENLPEEAKNREEEVQQLSQTMAQQMQAILETKNQIKLNSRQITDPEFLNDLNKEAEAKAVAEAKKDDGIDIEEIILPAGEIAYAQLITEANSDTPGPVLAQIAGGPLNGARILGSFQVQEEMLTLNFDTIVMQGISYDINAIALDPGTTLPAMATDVDHHYFKRVVLPAAAAFVEGMSSAISESGRTSITVSGETVASSEEEASDDQEVASGIEEAGQKLGEILDDIADKTKVTVIIKSGTPMGVLFLEPVIKKQRNENQRYLGGNQLNGQTPPVGSGNFNSSQQQQEAANNNAGQ